MRAAIVAALVAAVGLWLHACGIESRSGDYQCQGPADCSDGRRCVDGWCVVGGPPDAGAADASPPAVVADAAPPDPDAAADAAPICPAACSRCEDGVCFIDCLDDLSCIERVTCPAGLACAVECRGLRSCQSGVSCGAAAACEVSCSGRQSCFGGVACGQAACAVECGARDSCALGIDCEDSCACETDCSGPSSCDVEPECPTGCSDGFDCFSDERDCDVCPA